MGVSDELLVPFNKVISILDLLLHYIHILWSYIFYVLVFVAYNNSSLSILFRSMIYGMLYIIYILSTFKYHQIIFIPSKIITSHLLHIIDYITLLFLYNTKGEVGTSYVYKPYEYKLLLVVPGYDCYTTTNVGSRYLHSYNNNKN